MYNGNKYQLLYKQNKLLNIITPKKREREKKIATFERSLNARKEKICNTKTHKETADLKPCVIKMN